MGMAALGHTISRGRYVVPSAFTFCSIACALISMQVPQLPAEPAWWIMYCCLLDKIDGTAARLLRAQTRIGVQLDSAADLLAFGIAPAHLFYRIMVQEWPFAGCELLWGAISLAYALATAWRLHRFNREAAGAQSNSFRGMPSTLSGAIFATYVVAFLPDKHPIAITVFALLMPALSIAMNLGYRSSKVTIPRRKGLLVLQSAFVAWIYYGTFTRSYPELLFASAMVALAISIFGAPRVEDSGDDHHPETTAS
jgi:CDP-diacylglycerol--serine O-phosphatidyltransferase